MIDQRCGLRNTAGPAKEVDITGPAILRLFRRRSCAECEGIRRHEDGQAARPIGMCARSVKATMPTQLCTARCGTSGSETKGAWEEVEAAF
jgi:hypothetical protein